MDRPRQYEDNLLTSVADSDLPDHSQPSRVPSLETQADEPLVLTQPTLHIAATVSSFLASVPTPRTSSPPSPTTSGSLWQTRDLPPFLMLLTPPLLAMGDLDLIPSLMPFQHGMLRLQAAVAAPASLPPFALAACSRLECLAPQWPPQLLHPN